MCKILLQTLEGRDFLGIFNADGITITDIASSTVHNLWVTNTVVRNLRTGIALRRRNLYNGRRIFCSKLRYIAKHRPMI